LKDFVHQQESWIVLNTILYLASTLIVCVCHLNLHSWTYSS